MRFLKPLNKHKNLKHLSDAYNMSTEQILFNILNKSSQTWVRYWENKEISGMTLPGEYVEIQSHFLTDDMLLELLEAGVKIQTISSKQIGPDAYCDVVFKRKIQISDVDK